MYKNCEVYRWKHPPAQRVFHSTTVPRTPHSYFLRLLHLSIGFVQSDSFLAINNTKSTILSSFKWNAWSITRIERFISSGMIRIYFRRCWCISMQRTIAPHNQGPSVSTTTSPSLLTLNWIRSIRFTLFQDINAPPIIFVKEFFYSNK